MATTGLVFSDTGFQHLAPPGHPECPERIAAIRDAFAAAEIDPPRIEPQPATRDDLRRVHTEDHIETVRATCRTGAPYTDPDTYMVAGSWDAALHAAGGAIAACKAVLAGDVDNAFSALRPPGHHAEADRALGFCLFNNVAVAARWLQAEAGLSRIAILDWDVHHGNGTQHIFYDDPSVYYLSLHQFPHYPGTGRPEERGANDANLNLIFPPGAPAEAWIDAVQSQAVPELEAFDPDFLLLSCGFDAHIDDPLSQQNLSTVDYATMTHLVKRLAGGKVVSLLEGGYDLHALGESAVAHFVALQTI